MQKTEYTLTAIFRDESGKCWKSTIWSHYPNVPAAASAIEKLIEKFRGSASEIIDYTITQNGIDEEKDRFCMNCTQELMQKQIAAGGNGFSRSEMDGTFWTFRGIYDREGKQACIDVLNNYEYKPPKRQTRGYA